MNVDTAEINTIEIWGGEPSLGIYLITPNLEILLNLFQNLNTFFLSTNWTITPINDLIDFIKEIDCKSNKKFTLNLQLSIDGLNGEINKQGHPGTVERYIKNIDLFFDQINKIKLKHIQINFLFHPVISQEIILKELDTYDKIAKYYKEMLNLIQEFDNRNFNKACFFPSSFGFPAIASPHNSTLEEGMALANCIKLFEYVKHTITPEDDNNPAYATIGGYEQFTHLDNIGLECGESGYRTFTILPDGTIAECSSSYICDFEEYNKELKENNDLEQYKISQIRKKHYFNPINATPEEIENYHWYVSDGGIRGVSAIYRNLNLGLLDELALSKQIPYTFHLDPEKALQHLTNTLVLQYCTRDNTIETHNPFICSPSTFRKYFNGITDLIYEQDSAQIKYNINHYGKNLNTLKMNRLERPIEDEDNL